MIRLQLRRLCGGVLSRVILGVWLFVHAGMATAQDINAAVELNQQAIRLHKAGKTNDAIPLMERALKIVKQFAGDESADAGSMMSNLAVMYKTAGNLPSARRLLEQSLKISRQQNGEFHQDTALQQNNLADCLYAQGEYAAARPLYERALQIYRHTLGEEHADTASAWSNLATAMQALGDYSAARPMFEHALRVQKRLSGDGHPDTAIYLNNLAGLLMEQGDYPASIQLYEQALKIKRSLLGEDHLSTAFSLNNLGYVLFLDRKFDAAKPYYEQALKVFKKVSGAEHSNTAMALNNLGGLMNELDDRVAARTYYEESLKIRKKTLGDGHVETADSLNNLGFLHFLAGEYDSARPYYDQALAIYQAKLGEFHPKTVEAVNNLMLLEAPQEKWESAFRFADQSRRATRAHVTTVLPALSEKEQLTFLEKNDLGAFRSVMSLALARMADEQVPALSAGWLLNGKAVGQEALAAASLLGRDKKNPQTEADAKALSDLRSRLASLSLAPPQQGQETARRKEIDDLAAREDQLTRKLANQSGPVHERKAWVEVDALRKAIPQDAVFIDIARFKVLDFKARGKEKRTHEARYVAWIIPAAEGGKIQMVDLGLAEPIELALQKARHAIATSANPDSLLRTEGEEVAEKHLRQELERVADLVWKPLVEKLGASKRLIISPDGALWLLPWSALPIAKEKYLVEDYSVRYVVSGRDILNQPSAKSAGAAPQIIADPDFDLDPEKTRQAIQAVFRTNNIDAYFQTRGAKSKSALGAVDRLPNTAVEAQLVVPSITKYAQKDPQTFTDRYALESVVKAIKRPSLLMMSTHGFFLQEQGSNAEALGASMPDINVPTLAANGKPMENPLLRCGMLLAGCNETMSAGGDDGILTGLEITGLDLRGTELVVLSACETGIGKIRNGEGVAGLRQAFQLAGARTVVATLWQVPDRDSMLIVSGFFSNLAEGEGKDDALRASQLKRIEARREKFGAAHPFFWAAWTLTGE